jgi:hypothetical protein
VWPPFRASAPAKGYANLWGQWDQSRVVAKGLSRRVRAGRKSLRRLSRANDMASAAALTISMRRRLTRKLGCAARVATR